MVKPMIDRALRRGQGDEAIAEDFLVSLLNQERKMWVVQAGDKIQACLIFSILTTRVRKLYVEVLSGERMDEWVNEMQALLEDFKDLVGATCIEASCRPGLAKYLKKMGWKQKAIIMSIENG